MKANRYAPEGENRTRQQEQMRTQLEAQVAQAIDPGVPAGIDHHGRAGLHDQGRAAEACARLERAPLVDRGRLLDQLALAAAEHLEVHRLGGDRPLGRDHRGRPLPRPRA